MLSHRSWFGFWRIKFWRVRVRSKKFTLFGDNRATVHFIVEINVKLSLLINHSQQKFANIVGVESRRLS
jgi:hypothetical protein